MPAGLPHESPRMSEMWSIQWSLLVLPNAYSSMVIRSFDR